MRKTNEICPICMEKHEIKTIHVLETNTFKGQSVEYDAQYTYCELSDESYANEEQLTLNDIAMKNAYREKMGLLKSDQISEIRSKYNISQADLCILLGWGQKTITRYESHQIQDNAHDSILRKLDNDPEWFLELLNDSKDSLSDSAYSKYYEAGSILFEHSHDNYLKSAIMSRYAKFLNNSEANGNKELSLDTVVDMIHYFTNSTKALYLVKLMKMLWYADSLSYKRYGHSISGMVYRSIPMGAAPIAYETIIDLSSVQYEEVVFDNGIGKKMIKTDDKEYHSLTKENKEVLNAVIKRFGNAKTDEIVELMHNEEAYKRTAKREIILYKYARSLSLE